MTEVKVPEGARDGDYLRIDGRPYRIVHNQAVPLHPSVDVEAMQSPSAGLRASADASQPSDVQEPPPTTTGDQPVEAEAGTSVSMDELVEQKAEASVNPPVEMEPTDDPPILSAPDVDLDGMTAAQLRAYAKRHSIDISGARRRDDIIAAIRQADTTEEE